MINYKLDNNLQEWDAWQELQMIYVEGDPNAQDFILPDTIENAEENEKVIQSWKKIAVFKATSKNSNVHFRIGFIKGEMNLLLKQVFKTNLKYGMRIGPHDTTFYVLPIKPDDEIKLELIEIADEDTPKYKDLALI